MAVSDLHRRIALTALAVAARYGFALGGGNALLAHGVTSRQTQDVDLFTNQERGVEAAAEDVQEALRAAGFTAQQHGETSGLDDLFPDMGDGLIEWNVTDHGGEQTVLQLAYFDRVHQPVSTDIGPVLSLEDVAGGKVCALASRVEPRDYADTGRLLERYTPAHLIGFARSLDPGLDARDFAEAGQRLDQLADSRFTRYGLTARDIANLRKRFTTWPRTTQAAAKLLTADHPHEEQHFGAQPAGSARDDPEAGD